MVCEILLTQIYRNIPLGTIDCRTATQPPQVAQWVQRLAKVAHSTCINPAIANLGHWTG
ncbi:hypothetical protein ACN4EG_08110 [Alkalinema pantanalense CENA528]|uniref:hypothetical protein n=1 Tax=Alkalinema pantanalense TaxID=1620705 RepID=UPI003D6E3F41